METGGYEDREHQHLNPELPLYDRPERLRPKGWRHVQGQLKHFHLITLAPACLVMLNCNPFIS